MDVYDKGFNANEWSVIIGLGIGLLLVFLLPRRFPPKAALVFFMCGVYTGFFYDNSLTTDPFIFYEVNDTSMYDIMDFLLYLAYGPVSYLFFYMFDYLRPGTRAVPIYIAAWVLMALGLEWMGKLCGIFHYVNGYQITYSVPVYLTVFLLWMALYYWYRALAVNGKL